MLRQRHAKIVATVGPSSAAQETLRALFLAGADVFRLNFSHGTHQDHAKVHAAIRSLDREVGRPIGILQDLQGPKIRIGTLVGDRFDIIPGFRHHSGRDRPLRARRHERHQGCDPAAAP
jgi:pyruvate kinase